MNARVCLSTGYNTSIIMQRILTVCSLREHIINPPGHNSALLKQTNGGESILSYYRALLNAIVWEVTKCSRGLVLNVNNNQACVGVLSIVSRNSSLYIAPGL